MKKTVQTAALAAALLLPAAGDAGTASAALRAKPVPVAATVAWKHAPRRHVVVDGTVWTCTGSACVARLHDDPATHRRACYRLSRMVGSVTAFDAPAGAMPPEELARCNRGR